MEVRIHIVDGNDEVTVLNREVYTLEEMRKLYWVIKGIRLSNPMSEGEVVGESYGN